MKIMVNIWQVCTTNEKVLIIGMFIAMIVITTLIIKEIRIEYKLSKRGM